jgi:hypothetical protein
MIQEGSGLRLHADDSFAETQNGTFSSGLTVYTVIYLLPFLIIHF